MPVETFGVELHAERAEQARERLNRSLAVDLFGTSIANGAFGVLLLNPPYDADAGTRGESSIGFSFTRPGTWQRTPAHLHRAPKAPRRLGAVPGIPLPKDQVLDIPRARARGLRPGRGHRIPKGRAALRPACRGSRSGSGPTGSPRLCWPPLPRSIPPRPHPPAMSFRNPHRRSRRRRRRGTALGTVGKPGDHGLTVAHQ